MFSIDQTRKPILYFILLYALTYMGNAVYNTFIPVYLSQKGFVNSAIGVLLALGPFVSIIAQPVWGAVTDRVKVKNSVLKLLLLGSAVTVMFYTVSDRFLYLFVVIAIFTSFQTPINSLNDAIALEYVDAHGFKFGPIRLAGAIGFGVMSVIAGVVANRYINNIFLLYFVLYMFALLSAFRLPKVAGHQAGRKKVSPLALLKNRKIVLLMVLSLIVQTTLGYYYSFFPIYYRQLGASSTLLGLATFIASASEIPFLVFADRILKKIRVEYILVASSLLMALRWLLVFLAPNKDVILLVQLLHGCNFIVFNFSLAIYINQHVPMELKASGQALSGLVSYGLSRIAGSMLGGVLSDAFGLSRMFLYNAYIAAAAAVFFGFVFIREARSGPAVKPVA